MISQEQIAAIRRLFFVEHWKVGTIASELGLHPDAVKRALATDSFNKSRSLAPRASDPFLEFIELTLKQHPRLRSTRLFEMLRERGYQGTISQLRRVRAGPSVRFHEKPSCACQYCPANKARSIGPASDSSPSVAPGDDSPVLS